MIKNLTGLYETVEYKNKRVIMLYDNEVTKEYPVHWHNSTEIIISLSNSLIVFSGGTKYLLKNEEILIIPPGELHSMQAQNVSQVTLQFDIMQFENIKIFDSIIPVFGCSFHITPKIDKKLYVIAKKCILNIYTEYYSNSKVSDVHIYINLLNILIEIRKYQLKHADKLTLPSDIIPDCSVKLNYIINYINQNFTEDLSLAKLSDIAGYSKYHFSRMFKRYTNISFVKYVSKQRVKMAEQLLANSKFSITEVAMRSGFTSLTTFNRIFKTLKKCTPSEFKQFYGKNNNTIV